MLKVKRAAFPSPEQWNIIIHGMRNPLNSWKKMDSLICHGEEISGVKATEEECRECPYSMWELGVNFEGIVNGNESNFRGCAKIGPVWSGFFKLGEKDKLLAKNLIKNGPEHIKFMRQLPVILDIKAPLYWWPQMDQYKIGTVTDSCSRMHTLLKQPFEIDDFCIDRLHVVESSKYKARIEPTEELDIACDFFKTSIYLEPIDILGMKIEILNRYRDKYLEEKEKGDKEGMDYYFNVILELLPQSYYQTRTWSANYAVLFNICSQRANHKLSEWNDFIIWIVDNVPYFRELCFDKLYETSKGFRELYENK